MKKLFILFSSMAMIAILNVQALQAQTTKTVGGGSANYATLKLAFDAINAGSITGAITLQLIANTTETASAVLNASGTGSASYTTINIYPTLTGVSVSGSLTAPLISLNGADNITIDGRVNASGVAKDLIITNTSTSTSATTSTIQFINSAENNTVKYCTLKGAETSTASGLILFSTATGGNGNDGNTIDNNNITKDAAGRPINAIFSLGSTGFENSGNIISNNNIYDFLNNGPVGVTSHGVYLFSNNIAWTITGNNLYETSSFAPVADVEYDVILINSSGTGFVISNNYIGGSAVACGGSAWTKTNAKNNTFYAIYLNVGTAAASSIQNNIIRNFVWNNSAAADWTGINIQAGTLNIGTTTANTIGSASGTGSIVIGNGGNGANVYGIKTAGTTDCQNNSIGSITVTNTDGTYANNFYGISRTSGGNTNIYNNVIGSSSTANSIQINSTSTANTQTVIGIYNIGGGSLTINSNIIANLHNGSTNNSTGVVDGIESSGTNTISNNTIHDLTNANANIASDNTASVCGISLTDVGSIKTVTGNTIYNLSNTNASFTGSVIGMYFTGSTGANTVSRNFIHNLSVNAATTAANLYGIKINAGVVTYSNNIISLGGNSATTIYGIYDLGTASQTCNFYFNSLYIGGSLGVGITNKSYCLYSNSSANTRNIRNNIFENARSTAGGSSLHYAAYFNYTVSSLLTLDFNDYYASGTGGVLGYYNSLDVPSLPLITGFDAYSMAIYPSFANAGGSSAANYIPTIYTLAGTYLSAVATDYASVSRAGTPTMGAYEVPLNLNVDVYIANVFQSSYITLKGAFDKINNGTHTGAIEIRIKANTTETASATLYQTGYTGAGGTSSYSSVNIYPTVTGITITGNINSPVVDFNGASNTTIDGRVGASGSSNDMIISNTNTGTSAVTIRFYNSATNNTIKYCTIKGSQTNSSNAVIFFTTSSSGNGNIGNLIDHNNITSSVSGRPINAIYSYGSVGRENSGIIISNNNIYDYLNPGSSSNGILLAGYTNNSTISNNSFYETTTFVPTGAYSYQPIRVTTNEFTLVSGNYIGGSAPMCAGLPFTVIASTTHYFCGIWINGGNGIASTVQNNIIQNISYTSVEDNPWDGMFINSGDVNVTGNTIGATTGINSIVVTTPLPAATTTITGGIVNNTISLIGGGSGYTTAPLITFTAPTTGGTAPTATISGGVVTMITVTYGGSGYLVAPNVVFDGQSNNYSTSHAMINNSIGTVTISNNNIGSITTVGSSTYSHGFETVYNRGASGTTTISNNLLGSLTTPNSIHTSSAATLALQKQDLYGLYSGASGTTIITDNTIANLTNSYNGTNGSSRTRPISTTYGSNTIQNNTIRNIITASGQTGGGATASIIGISQSAILDGTTQTVTGNTIYNLSNINSTSLAIAFGIYYAGPNSGTNAVSKNFIHSISIASTNTNCDLEGIVLNGGLTTVANNIINIGVGITNGYKVYGIWDASAASNNSSIYFNSIYIGGSVSSGTTSSTACLRNAYNTSTRNYRNNILFNARSGGTTGKHYAIYLAGTTGLTIEFNDYFTTGTNGVLGFLSSDKTTLALWKTATGQDVNSTSINPAFTNAGSMDALDYKLSFDMNGVAGTGITTDYGSSIRHYPTLGAWERVFVNKWKGTISSDWNTANNWTGNEVPPVDAIIVFDDAPLNHCQMDQNRSVTQIYNNQSTYRMLTNGFKLTVKGDLNFTNGAQIDASSSNSTVEFAGNTAQSIPTGAFYNNEVYNLTVNNPNNLTINGTLRLLNTLAAISGLLDAVTNSPTIIYGAASAQTIDGSRYFNDAIYNLTIDNSSGVTLHTNFTINNNLVINSGKSFAVAAGKDLTSTGTITNSAGTSGFILKSDTTGTASLLHNTYNVPATVHRYISGTIESWHFLSSPVAAQDINENQGNSDAWLPSGTYPNGTGYDMYLWNEPTASWIFKLNPSWNTINPGTNFIVGQGYLYAVQAPNPTKKFAGALNNGSINYNITASSSNCCLNGFNLVGNPYPSTIDWYAASGWARSGLVSNGGGNDMWIWNSGVNNYGVYNSADADGVGTNSVNRYIAPMQAYFVRAASNSTLGMDNTLRAHSAATWFKGTEQDVNRLSLSVTSDASYGSDEIRLNFGYSENEKGALKLFSTVLTAPSLYMRTQADTLSVRYFTSPQENPVVPVSFISGINGSYTINCNFDPNNFKTVLLEDRQTNYIQNMKTTTTYNFSASTSDDANRFVLYFQPDYIHAKGQLPANIYTDGNQLIVDLTLIDKDTEVKVYDMLGRLLLQQSLASETKNKINLIADSQILFIYLKNTDGTLCHKLFYYSKK